MKEYQVYLEEVTTVFRTRLIKVQVEDHQHSQHAEERVHDALMDNIEAGPELGGEVKTRTQKFPMTLLGFVKDGPDNK